MRLPGRFLTPLLFTLLPGTWACAQPAHLLQISIRAGLTRDSVLGTNPQDMVSAFKDLARILGRKYGYDIDVQPQVFDRNAEFEASVRSGEIQVGIIGTWEYLNMNLGPNAEPAFVHVNHDHATSNFMLVTSRKSGLNSLRDLKGADLVVLQNPSSPLSMAWLDTLLEQDKLGPKETFFKRVELAPKPSAAVLPVFFGNRQACLVDQDSFQVMAELNPQINQVLQPIALSQPFVNSLLFLGHKGWPSEQVREEFRKALLDLPLTAEGRQLLMIFKVDRLEAFKEEYLDTALKLKAECLRIARKRKP